MLIDVISQVHSDTAVHCIKHNISLSFTGLYAGGVRWLNVKYVMRRTKTLSSSAVESGTTVSLDQGDILEVKLDLSESQQVSVIAKLVKVSESLEGTPINSVVLQISL